MLLHNFLQAAGRTIVVSVPLELSTDHQEILNLANEHGFVTASMCCERKGWSSARFQGSINVLLKEGMAWIDIHGGTVAVQVLFVDILIVL